MDRKPKKQRVYLYTRKIFIHTDRQESNPKAQSHTAKGHRLTANCSQHRQSCGLSPVHHPISHRQNRQNHRINDKLVALQTLHGIVSVSPTSTTLYMFPFCLGFRLFRGYSILSFLSFRGYSVVCPTDNDRVGEGERPAGGPWQ